MMSGQLATNATLMHPIFQIDDILRLIVAHVVYPTSRHQTQPWSYGSASSAPSKLNHGTLGNAERRALAKMARVSRIWVDAALDALWKEIPTVEPLFGLFHSSCLSSSNRHESVQFSRPLVPSDWTRFIYYAPRVQRISLLDTRWTRWTVDPKTFLYLSHFHPRGSRSILPNLQHWSWDTHRGAGDIVGGMCFLSPTVTSIEVTLGHTTSHDTLFGFLYNLPMRCPALATLAIEYNDREWPDWGLEATMTALQSIFAELPMLKRLSLPFFMDTPQFIGNVGRIPGLKELVISCPEKLVGHFIDDDSDEGLLPTNLGGIGGAEQTEFFGDLTSVTLQSTMSSCFRFLRRFSSRNIQHMYLTVLHLRSSTQLSECVHLVSAHCPALKTFHIQYTPAQHDISFDTSYFPLNALRECIDLEELSVGHPRVAPWTDDEVLEAIQCWPKLKVLRLNPRPNRAVAESRLTLRTLWNVVKWCPNLEVVRFYVDTAVIPDLNALARQEAGIGATMTGTSTAAVSTPGSASVTSTALAMVPAKLGAAGIKGSTVLSLVDFGISQRVDSSTQELATFIATLCPSAQVQGSEIWKEVSTILKVNQATRVEDQRKIDTLRAEVERLMALLGGKAVGLPV